MRSSCTHPTLTRQAPARQSCPTHHTFPLGVLRASAWHGVHQIGETWGFCPKELPPSVPSTLVRMPFHSGQSTKRLLLPLQRALSPGWGGSEGHTCLPEQSLDISSGQRHSSASPPWIPWAESSLCLLQAVLSLQPASRSPACKTKIAQVDKRPWGQLCNFPEE